MHELVLTRVGLRRLAKFLGKDDVPLADLLAILPVMSTMVRTVAYLLKNIGDDPFDWDEVLDELNEEWEIDI